MDNEKFRGRIRPQIMAQELAKVRNRDGGSLWKGSLFSSSVSLEHSVRRNVGSRSPRFLASPALAGPTPPSFCFIQVDSIRVQIEAELSRIIGKLLQASSEGVKGARDLQKHRPYVKYHDDDRAVWAYLVKHSKAFKVG